MKVKLLVSRSGVDFTQRRGDVLDLAEAEAVALINAGQAEPVRDAPIERAVIKPGKVEKAVK